MFTFIQRWNRIFLLLVIACFTLAFVSGWLLLHSCGLHPGLRTQWWKLLLFVVSWVLGCGLLALLAGYGLAKKSIGSFSSKLKQVRPAAGLGIMLPEQVLVSGLEAPAGGQAGPLDHYVHSYARVVHELQHANDFLLSLIENSTDAIYVMDLNGMILKVNPAFHTLYGFTLEEVSGTSRPFVPERLRGEYKELIAQVCAGMHISGYETIRQNKDGTEVHISLSLYSVLDAKGRKLALAATSRNITERKQTEELLRRSEKLSVIGQLAAGVAHEIRNPLTTLRGFVQLFRQRNAGNAEHLELMLTELDRINFIIGEFIILSKPHLNQFMLKDLGVMLTDMIRLLEPQANLNNVQIETYLQPELPKVKCEENQLKQVFLNVIKNSMESMPDGGIVRIQATLLPEDRILVRVTDQGTGIPEDLLPRLGEPFLTNKENGTGLGIMVSQRIMANHMGQLTVRSRRGVGTCVDVVLPVDFELMPSATQLFINRGMTP